MKVILLQDVKSLGKKGELVEVSEGYGRNFLLPRNIAKEANAQAMNEYKNAENSKKYKIDTAKAQAESYKKQLEGKTFKMTAKAATSRSLVHTRRRLSCSQASPHRLIFRYRKLKIIDS